ncbi:DUF302 domain-containing protein [Tissierella sp.]|uniref:DUF302 domain-containing protein n=1 Tax=Tissierella sp. TaxID=41274 RepID=UPI00285B32A0|nr:DUF302 domain-containing protein [Tissierella sp.]MDR7855132.1 DUF302 domain-containing protein [Tissierella sp.]
MNLIYEKVTEKPFNEAVQSITDALKERKFGVLWQLNFKDKMAEHDIDFPNNFMILEVCNPQKANEVLTKHIEMGYFLPCKMVVYEKDGEVRIGTARPEMLMGMMGYDDLGDVASEVEKILIESIDAAV